MGFVQMGFGVSQVLGIPIGLFIASKWGWNVPFFWIASMAGMIAITLYLKLKPVKDHLALRNEKSAFSHLWHTLSQKNYRIGFLSTSLLSVGGFMMMPFGSAFAVNNLKVTMDQLPLLFMITGVGTLIVMPFVGKLSDQVDKFKIFAFATLLAILIINIYAQFAETPFWVVVCTNVVMMMAIMSRFVPSSALTSAIPSPKDRGAFMSINSSLQQIAGGFGAMIAGLVIVQQNNYSPLEHYDTLAMIASSIMLLTIFLLFEVNKIVTSSKQ
jgi:predicted MFS family arabinose efflux permease